MKKITNIPYSKTDFRFIQNHYDLHLSGTCIYNNRLPNFSYNSLGFGFMIILFYKS